MTGLAAPSAFADEPLLLHELNHRINNEFAAAISALSLSAARSAVDEVKIALSEVRQLLHHYADVHRALQMPEDDRLIDAADYLTQLCLSISRSKLEVRKTKLALSVQSLSLPAGRCWLLGMILYELITNAARHAFECGGGEIRVAVRCDGAFVKCSVQDNGSAVPSAHPGRGIRIVDALNKALGGHFKQTFGKRGSKSMLVFPRNHKASAIAGRTSSTVVQNRKRTRQIFRSRSTTVSLNLESAPKSKTREHDGNEDRARSQLRTSGKSA